MSEAKNADSRFPAANLAQWISAFASVVTVCLAVWALFFSSASQSLVQYLQSELSYRNSKIASLEVDEATLRTAILSREQTVRELQVKADSIKADLLGLERSRAALFGENKLLSEKRKSVEKDLLALGEQLLVARSSVVKFKLLGLIKERIVSTKVFSFIDEDGTIDQLKSKDIEVWSDYSKFIADLVDNLKGSELLTGKDIQKKFLTQCSYLKNNLIHVPSLSSPIHPFERSDYFSLSDLERQKLDSNYSALEKEFLAEIDSVTKQILDAQVRIENCFEDIQ